MESELTVEKLCNVCGNVNRFRTRLMIFRGTTNIYQGTFYDLFDYMYNLNVVQFSISGDKVCIYVF